MKPRYLLLDLDGTLVDSVPDLTCALNLLREELSLPHLGQPEVAAMVGDGASVLVRRALGVERYRPEYLDRFLAIYSEHLLDSTRCYPGIEELLTSHPPERLALITNKPFGLTIKLLEGLNLLSHFKFVVGGDSLPCKKPDPLPVLAALEALGAQPGEAVMIGDHHTDLHSGRNAGTLTCFCAYGLGNADGLTSDFHADQPTDLLRLFPGTRR